MHANQQKITCDKVGESNVLPHELLLYIWLHVVDDQSHPNNNEKVKKKKLSKVGVLLFKIVDPTMQESDDDK